MGAGVWISQSQLCYLKNGANSAGFEDGTETNMATTVLAASPSTHDESSSVSPSGLPVVLRTRPQAPGAYIPWFRPVGGYSLLASEGGGGSPVPCPLGASSQAVSPAPTGTGWGFTLSQCFPFPVLSGGLFLSLCLASKDESPNCPSLQRAGFPCSQKGARTLCSVDDT